MSKKTKDQVTMDDIYSWMLRLHELIEEDVDLPPNDLDDLIWDAMSRQLEKFFNYPDYGNYN